MRCALAAAFVLILAAWYANAQELIPCRTWCSQCNPTPNCDADCIRKNDPMVKPNCQREGDIPCAEWCNKCNPGPSCMNACNAKASQWVRPSCDVRQ